MKSRLNSDKNLVTDFFSGTHKGAQFKMPGISGNNKNTNNMKRILLLLTLTCMLFPAIYAQDLSVDFVVIDPAYPNYERLKAQYEGNQNVCILEVSRVMAPEQITAALNGKQVTDLHLFVAGKPGTLGFGNIALNPDDVNDYATSLGTWSSHVSGKVVIHNQDVFLSEPGTEMKAKLEQLTGLNFVMQ
mgnify:CR=1 FL=1